MPHTRGLFQQLVLSRGRPPLRSVLTISICKIQIEGLESQNHCLCALQHALWKLTSPRSRANDSRLNFWQLAVPGPNAHATVPPSDRGARLRPAQKTPKGEAGYFDSSFILCPQTALVLNQLNKLSVATRDHVSTALPRFRLPIRGYAVMPSRSGSACIWPDQHYTPLASVRVAHTHTPFCTAWGMRDWNARTPNALKRLMALKCWTILCALRACRIAKPRAQNSLRHPWPEGGREAWVMDRCSEIHVCVHMSNT